MKTTMVTMVLAAALAACGAEADRSAEAQYWDRSVAEFPAFAGETDDAPRLQRAVDASANKVLFVPAGDYRLAQTLVITNFCSVLMHKGARFLAEKPMDFVVRVNFSPVFKARDILDFGTFFKGGRIERQAVRPPREGRSGAGRRRAERVQPPLRQQDEGQRRQRGGARERVRRQLHRLLVDGLHDRLRHRGRSQLLHALPRVGRRDRRARARRDAGIPQGFHRLQDPREVRQRAAARLLRGHEHDRLSERGLGGAHSRLHLPLQHGTSSSSRAAPCSWPTVRSSSSTSPR